MSDTTHTNTLEKKEVLEDNARKFIVGAIDRQTLEEMDATSYMLVVDWLETGEDNERKVAYKTFDSGDVQILLISKVTKDGNRTSEKEKITKEKHDELITTSVLHLEKKRYEFEYLQDDISFSIKYDEFADSDLRILEADASSEEKRDLFNPGDFPNELIEVTGDMKYYGFRVATIL